ncbi:DUF488 domain-containing protein [Tissierella creatinini]|nr:DUF488 domain-containing protein [Tissierella creatinini]TJX60394.1 DUF488 domain-containing protein [Soehngenia saccharolytica]
MKNKIYTIGFTKKTAERFFNILKENRIELVLDIRLNNTSQLAGFAKFPDIKYFLNQICGIEYIHDVRFSPSEETLKRYKKKAINWEQYISEFNITMNERNINKDIKENYSLDKNVCLLCSEVTSENCHRSLVSSRFKDIFGDIDIINL